MKKKFCFPLLALVALMSVLFLTACGLETSSNPVSGADGGSQVDDSHTHEFGQWTTVKEATCAAEGEQSRSCSGCDETETKPIDKLSHNYGEWSVVTEATCGAEGKKEQTCTNCGEKNSESIAKPEHTWQDATCAAPKTCTVCGATDGNPSAHAYPTSDFKCKDCGQAVHASDYEYLAGTEFRKIRYTYSTAVATYATMILYTDGYGDVCTLIKIYYTIGGYSFNDLILYNFTDNKRVFDPVDYYEDAADRAWGNQKLMYLNMVETILEMELHMLNGEYTHTVSGDYLNL